jgi:hypothetical protein
MAGLRLQSSLRHVIQPHVDKWSLHHADRHLFIISNVQIIPAAERMDLLHLDCSASPSKELQRFRSLLHSLWLTVEWGISGTMEHAEMLDMDDRSVYDVWNPKNCGFTPGMVYDVEFVMTGFHCDTRRGAVYSPILVMEAVKLPIASSPHLKDNRVTMEEESLPPSPKRFKAAASPSPNFTSAQQRVVTELLDSVRSSSVSEYSKCYILYNATKIYYPITFQHQ